MRDIIPGDFVFSPTGDPVLVEAVSEIFHGHRCYRVIFSDHSELIADADHLWKVQNDTQRSYNGELPKSALWIGSEYSILSTETISKKVTRGKRHMYSVDITLPLKYPEADLPVDPYFIGYWLGDGSCRSGHFTTMGQDVIDILDEEYYVTKISKDKGKASDYKIEGMTTALERLGLLRKRRTEGAKHIPDLYMRASYEQRLELLRGLMDSDGTIDKRTGTCVFGGMSKTLVENALELILSLGIKATWFERDVYLYEKYCGIGYGIGFTTDIRVFNIERKYKYQRSELRSTQGRKYITDISEVPTVPTKCIRVASADGLFLAGKYLTITHNSRAILEKLHLCASKYPRMRALLVRKTRESLTQSAMVTFEKFVIPENNTVTFRTAEQEYRYVNGSKVVLGGMDKASKVLSSEYDLIYVQEATELEEEDWETLVTRNRYGVMPYNQIIGDCNPSYPTHWLYQRMMSGKITRIRTDHKDNPVYWLNGDWTEQGRNYISKLDALTGVRYKRLRLGIWCSAEGMIYDEWSAADHLITLEAAGIQKDWRRVWTVDFGYTNPFVLQAWAISPTGVAYRFFEIYHTKLLVEDAATIMKIWQRNNREPDPEAIICDWDAEGRATLERHLGMQTTAANKNVNEGIQAVKSRLKGRTLFLVRDATFEKDYELDDAKKPTCTEQEIEAYEWEDKKKKEQPKKADDHGMDAMRYLAMYETDNTLSWSRGMR